jgi:23S rRNA (adenine1618-N6)-methyltransferase
MSTITKHNLHPRNLHNSPYNFEQLMVLCPALKEYVFVNKYNTQTIDFTNAVGVKLLNKALLKQFYGIDYWDIPAQYLCPPIPGRADYIHTIADILAASNGGTIPTGNSIKVLDIGVGANCIYPLLGHNIYNWSFVGTDIDASAVTIANEISMQNNLQHAITCRHQAYPSSIVNGIIPTTETFAITMCNPPFHASEAEAQEGSQRKWKNLGHSQAHKPNLNFGGHTTELWCKGGEVGFIKRMIDESKQRPTMSVWFTSLVSKNTNLPAIYYALDQANVTDIKTIDMGQGNKISRVVAWTFLTKEQQANYFK